MVCRLPDRQAADGMSETRGAVRPTDEAKDVL